MPLRTILRVACTVAVAIAVAGRAHAAAPPSLRIDFHDPSQVAGWHPAHNVGSIRATPDGMEIEATGPDPFITGPAFDLPAGLAPDDTLLLELRLKSEQGGFVEVFHFPAGGHATPTRSVTTRVAAGTWQDVRLPLPPLERRIGLRLDPPGAAGRTVIASMSLRPRPRLPKWPAQVAPQIDAATAPAVRSGDLSLL